MDYSLIVKTNASTITIILSICMFAAFVLGRTLRHYWKLNEAETEPGVSMIQTTLYALFGFILAFTFGISAQRYDTIRNVYIEEAQAFGTALGRADLYDDSVRQPLRTEFKAFLEARIQTYSNVFDQSLIEGGQQKTIQEENRLWNLVVAESKKPNMFIPSNLMIPALNGLFDVALKRDLLMRSHVPDIVVYMLLILALVSSFIGGLTTTSIKKRDWLIILCYILFTSLVIFITLDLGRPLRGIVRADSGKAAIEDLRKMFE